MMNEIDAQVITLVGRFVTAIIALVLGGLLVRWGTKLYITGVPVKAGSVTTIFKDAQFVLRNAAPGTFLSCGGVIVMITALMTMPGYDQGRVATANEKSSIQPAIESRYRNEEPVALATPQDSVEVGERRVNGVSLRANIAC